MQSLGTNASTGRNISEAPTLRSVVEAGLTSSSVISLVSGISEREISRLIRQEIQPTPLQREILERLLWNYRFAIQFVNAETMRGRIY
jgi:hypothetical protein